MRFDASPHFQFVIPKCTPSTNSLTLDYYSRYTSWISPKPQIYLSSGSLSKLKIRCDIIYTPFFPSLNQYDMNDDNRNSRMYNMNDDLITPWPLYPILHIYTLQPHQLRTFEQPLPSLDSLITNPIEKYFHVETQSRHYGVNINIENNGDGTTTKTTSITNRLIIAINDGFKPESKLTIKLSLPKVSLSRTTSSSSSSMQSTASISSTLSTAVQLRQSTNIRSAISTLNSANSTVDTTTSNNYDIHSLEFDISDYAHPELIIDINIPIHTSGSEDSDDKTIQPNGDIYIAQFDENGNNIIQSFSPLSSIPIELIYYNRGTTPNKEQMADPNPITLSQSLSYTPSFEFLPNLQCTTIEFPTLPPLPLPEDKIATITFQLQSTPLHKPSTEILTTYNSNSFWKTLLSSSTPSTTTITTKIYPNSIITIDYSQSSSTISYILNSFEFHHYPKSTTNRDWSPITHNATTKTLSFTYIGTTTIIIDENDNDYNINKWFTFEFQFDNENDEIILTTSITMDSTIQSTPTILNTQQYDVEYIIGDLNYQGGKFTIYKIDSNEQQQRKLYLLLDKLDDDTTTPPITSSFIAIAGTTQFNLTLSSPNQNVEGITTIKLMYYDLPSTTTNINSLSPLPTPIEVYSFTKHSFEPTSTTTNQSITHIITIPTTITSIIINSKFVFFQIIFTPNDITQINPLTSIVNSQTFEILSPCFSLPTNNNNNDINSPLKYINTCGVNGTCLRNGQCECYNNYSGDKCTIRSKCIGYCINGNYDSCDENIDINSTTQSTTSPCRCKQGWIGLQCDQIDNNNNEDDDDTTPQSQRKPNKTSTSLLSLHIIFIIVINVVCIVSQLF